MKTRQLLIKIFFALFLIYGFIGFFILPNIIKEQIVLNAKNALNREVEVESVSLNPYTFGLEVNNLVIHGNYDVCDFAGVRQLSVNIDPFNLIFAEIKVKYLEITAPYFVAHKNREGVFNFADLLVSEEANASKPSEEKSKLPKIVVEKFSLTHGKLSLTDETGLQTLSQAITSINFTVNDFSTAQEHDNQLSLRIDIDDGGYVDYRGKINSLEPLRLEGEIALHEGRVYTLWEHVRDSLGISVADGIINASLAYSADLSAQPMQINIKKYKLQVDRLRLQDKKTKENILKLPFLALEGDADLATKEVNIERFKIEGLFVKASRDEWGKINWLTYLPEPEAKAETEQENNTSETETPPVHLVLRDFNLSGATVHFEDQFNVSNALTQIDRINVTLTDLNSSENTWAKSTLALRLNKTGELRVKSKIRHTPLKVETQMKMLGLDLSSFQTYVNAFANMDINSGRFNFDAKAEIDKTTKLRANTWIDELSLSERREGKKFFGFSKLMIKDVDFSLTPDSMKISNIDIDKPYARMKIDEKKATNLDGLMVSEGNRSGAEEKSESKKERKKPFSVLISKVNFKDGKGEFSDLSLPLPFKTDIHDLNGKMLGLGNIAGVKSVVDIDGVVDEYGLAKIEGSFLPSKPKVFTDIGLKFQNIDMTNLSPYSGKFIGNKLEKGKMNVELDYKINNSQMQGGNRVVLKQLTLGESVESEDAISAPVGLAIALLKDSDGVIDLDVPVTGDVDAPDFAVGHIVWTAFKNLIVGIATAPFRFLGDMLGISAEELESIHFEAGKSNLLPPEREKLDKLSTALASKKMLTLKVAGHYDERRDMLAMKTAKLYEEALVKLEDNTTDLAHMDRDDFDELMEELYVVHFGEDRLDALQDAVKEKELDRKMKKEMLRQELTDALREDQNITQADLENLAKKRAEEITSFLVTKGVETERLSLLESVRVQTTATESEYIPTKLELGAR